MLRNATHRYRDPLDTVWLETARRIGLTVRRDDAAYASTDGKKCLILAATDLDPDDCVAQMVFHELCHSLVEGEEAFAKPDWGLDNASSKDTWREHACLRVQATLSGYHGLRRVLAPTTDHRPFYDALPADALADRSEPSVNAAIAGLRRAGKPPWGPHLDKALQATRHIAETAGTFERDSESLWALLDPRPEPHRLGGVKRLDSLCGHCVWRGGGGRCEQHQKRCRPDETACDRFEEPPDCQACGACCRAAYHSVEVAADDPKRETLGDMVVDRGSYLELRRKGDRCAALLGGLGDFRCAVYADRPATCHEFTNGSEHCLTARRRVGLSL